MQSCNTGGLFVNSLKVLFVRNHNFWVSFPSHQNWHFRVAADSTHNPKASVADELGMRLRNQLPYKWSKSTQQNQKYPLFYSLQNLVSPWPTLQICHGVTSMEAIYPIKCSFLGSHQRLDTTFFTYAAILPKKKFTLYVFHYPNPVTIVYSPCLQSYSVVIWGHEVSSNNTIFAQHIGKIISCMSG